MDKFIVSARKYRPQVFNTVVGQSHITTTLKNAIHNNQLAHAFLFCGPRGVGKTTCARILAKTINCETKTTDGEACDTCNSCKSFNEGTSLNIHELDAASNNSVDDIRALVEQVRFSPQAGAYKVYIVDEVHMLSTAAFNAFLKTLEEPPPYAIFILATTEKHKILPTILSRCQIFDFKRITTNDTVQHLEEICEKEKINAEKAALQVIAHKSEGCMRDALSIMDKIVSFTNGELNYKNTLEHLNVLDEDYFFKILDYFTTQNLPDALLLYDEINKKGFEGDTFLQGLAEFARNLLVCKDEKSAMLMESIESFRKKYITKAKELDASWIISTLSIINEAEINYKQARNKKLLVEMVLIKLCYLQQALETVAMPTSTTFKKVVQKGMMAFKIKPIHNLTSSIANNNTALEATLTIATTAPTTNTMAAPEAAIVAPTVTKLDFKALKNIRNIAVQNTTESSALEVITVTPDTLQNIWLLTADELNKDGQNASIVSHFKLAQLHLINHETFKIIVGSNVQEKAILANRNFIMERMQQHFNNKNIKFTVDVESTINTVVDAPITKSSKVKYAELVANYPLVQKLKDSLGFELD